MALIQQQQIQVPNYLAAIQAGQEQQINRAKLEAYQNEKIKADRENQKAIAIDQLSKISLDSSNPQAQSQALDALAAASPDIAKKNFDYLYQKSERAGAYATTINQAPRDKKPQVYESVLKMARNDPLIDSQALNDFPDKYTPDLDAKLYAISQGHRKLEDALKAQQEQATLASTQAETPLKNAQAASARAEVPLKTAQTFENNSKTNLQNAEADQKRIETDFKYGNNYRGPLGQAQAKADSDKLATLSKQADLDLQNKNKADRFVELAGKINPVSPVFGSLGKYIAPLENINQLPEYKEFSNISTQLAGQAAKQNVGSRVSNYEAKLYQDNAANAASGTKQSNINFANQYKAVVNRGIEQNQFYQEYTQIHGDLRGADRAWSKFTTENPILEKDKKTGTIKVNENNIGNWQSYLDSKQNTSSLSEGQTAINPKTGERLIFKGGKWQTP